MILHITTQEAWNKAQRDSSYTAPSLESDGFIHCSTLKQTVHTANVFFKGQKRLVLLCIDEKALKSECKFEAPCGHASHDPEAGNLFPHIYGPINISAVIKVLDFPSNEIGVFTLPEQLLSK